MDISPEYVYPDLFIPGESLAAGEVRNLWSSSCLDLSIGAMNQLEPLKLFPCHSMGGHQYWMFSKNGEIRRDEMCLDFIAAKNMLALYPCHGMGGNQMWLLNGWQIKHKQTDECLTVSGNDTPVQPLPISSEMRYAILSACKKGDKKQEWEWFWYKS